MTAARSPVEQALDLLVFAPLGLAALAAEHLPGLADKGRRNWESQASMAKVVGQFAVGRGRKEATTVLRRAGDALGQFGGRTSPGAARPAPADSVSPPRPARPRPAGAAGSADDLAIPGYDALSAPQVVSRLDGLSADELEDVRAYEAGTRGRRTVLGRVAQLQALLD